MAKSKKECPSGKRRYRDELAAKIRLLGIGRTNEHRTGRLEPPERRAYYCPFCRGWHLTSQEKTTRGGAS